ncbi:MAG: hypothetical protein K9M54_02290 [Kiritimatiellales bacterium]|nr:hypothetical protein [Kiritimatiellales bacterium]
MRYVLLAACISIALFPATPARSDTLYESFQHPSMEAKPFVRWWWGENRVEKGEIVRELDLLKDAGIGGVEIQPIGVGRSKQRDMDTPKMEWLSPEWCDIVKFTCDEAAKRGMQVDVSHSYGWPAGGDFLTPKHRASILYSHQEKVSGPAVFQKPLDSLFDKNPWKEKQSTLKYARLVPLQLNRMEDILNVEHSATNGILTVNIPDGDYILQTGIVVTEFKGNMLDHFDREAVQAYHTHLKTQLAGFFGGDLGSGIHAFFADSIEVKGSNWTRFMEDEFRKRRGYDMTPYLSFLTRAYEDRGNYEDLFTASDSVKDLLRKARYDYNSLLAELIQENFWGVFQNWCTANGVLCRLQVYGHPWHFGIDSANLIADIPEGNSWMTTNGFHTGNWSAWNKFASSAGHARGRKTISTEAMTSTSQEFEHPLDWVKRADDFNFIQGINHSVLHGFHYSPPEVPWPGIVIYGTFFSEHNTWWPYFPKWTAYNARLSQLFQSTQPVVEIALLGPEADTWSDCGLERSALHSRPWYGYDHLWKTFGNHGSSVDFVSERILNESSFEGGTLNIGPMRYRLLVLCDVETLHLDSVQAIERFVEQGGQVAVVGTVPGRTSGLGEPANKAIGDVMQRLFQKHPGRIKHIAPPAKNALMEWTGNLLAQFNLDRKVRIDHPDERVYQIHQRDGSRNFVFFSNQDAGHAVDIRAKFHGLEGPVYRWDPETGNRIAYAPARTEELPIRLGPSESLLLAFDPDASEVSPKPEMEKSSPNTQQVDAPWQLELTDFQGVKSSRALPSLVDFAGDPELDTFAGTAVYSASIVADKAWKKLDLGPINGVSQLKINGIPAGIRWYGAHVYDVTGMLVSGSNTVEVSVTTLLFNHVRQKAKPLSAGMPGPVRLTD